MSSLSLASTFGSFMAANRANLIQLGLLLTGRSKERLLAVEPPSSVQCPPFSTRNRDEHPVGILERLRKGCKSGSSSQGNRECNSNYIVRDDKKGKKDCFANLRLAGRCGKPSAVVHHRRCQIRPIICHTLMPLTRRINYP